MNFKFSIVMFNISNRQNEKFFCLPITEIHFQIVENYLLTNYARKFEKLNEAVQFSLTLKREY